MPNRPPKQEQEQASEEITEVAPGILRLQLPDRDAGPRPRQHLRDRGRRRLRPGRSRAPGTGVVEGAARPHGAGRDPDATRPPRDRDPLPPRPLRRGGDAGPGERGRGRRVELVPHLVRPDRGDRRAAARLAPERRGRRGLHRPLRAPDAVGRRQRQAQGRRAGQLPRPAPRGEDLVRATPPEHARRRRRPCGAGPPRVGGRAHPGPHQRPPLPVRSRVRRPLSGDHVLPTITPHISGLHRGRSRCAPTSTRSTRSTTFTASRRCCPPTATRSPTCIRGSRPSRPTTRSASRCCGWRHTTSAGPT